MLSSGYIAFGLLHLMSNCSRTISVQLISNPDIFFSGIVGFGAYCFFIPAPAVTALKSIFNSVSDPYTSNADPDPGLWLNTDPGFRIPVLNTGTNQHKQIFLTA